MELIFEPHAWQSPDGQGTWFYETEIWSKSSPNAHPELLGKIMEGDEDADSWAVFLNGSDLDGNEYIGMETAENAVREYYAAQENPAETPSD